MPDEKVIPILTDLIEKGQAPQSDQAVIPAPEKKLISEWSEDLRNGDTRQPRPTPATHTQKADNEASTPALENEVKRILNEHMELAWQEIRIAIKRFNNNWHNN